LLESIQIDETAFALTIDQQSSQKLKKKLERTVFLFKEPHEIEERRDLGVDMMTDKEF